MATVNSYTAAKIDSLVNARSPLGHTHSLADVGIGPWIDYTDEIELWSINGSNCDLGTPGSNAWSACEYRMFGPDMMFYKGQFTFQTGTSLVAGRYVGVSMPFVTAASRQGGNVTVIRQGSYYQPRTTQYMGMSGATPNHPVMVFPNGLTTGAFALPSDGWQAGDALAWNMFVKLA